MRAVRTLSPLLAGVLVRKAADLGTSVSTANSFEPPNPHTDPDVSPVPLNMLHPDPNCRKVIVIETDYVYEYPWATTVDHVDRIKRAVTEPRAKLETVETSDNVTSYDYALRLPKFITFWFPEADPFHFSDTVELDEPNKLRVECGENVTMADRGRVREMTVWYEDKNNPDRTGYRKQLVIDRIDWCPGLIMRAIERPLRRWFLKSVDRCRAREERSLSGEEVVPFPASTPTTVEPEQQ
eukprot:m.74978 g.74978  ORF g.74978 m.74978 type:complete len:239 (+) comp12425_c1_seq1:318-1034(+)